MKVLQEKKGVVLQRSILELKGVICNEVEKESAKRSQYAFLDLSV